jgi:hypothetical protein
MPVLHSLLNAPRRHPFTRPAGAGAPRIAASVQVLGRTRPRRVRLEMSYRWLWVWLSKVWTEWRTVLVIVEPATVLPWHSRGLRLFWRWKSRGRTGRPPVHKRSAT